ncbi:hypothetical protein [Burkholderia gladioli]|uniref:hypothetical protein n=1 Tax=Burkholderia gladioli TaxID=28095 RepID=UPI00163E3826|nr:hypothetical protein [Burkholderia gladioli]
MSAMIEIVKCRAVVDGRLRHWIMLSAIDNASKAREIFQDEKSFEQFAVVGRANAETADPDADVFTYVTADMDMSACLRHAVEMGGDDLRLR